MLIEADLELLVQIIDAVRLTGATANSHCGVHVHIGAMSCTVEHVNRAIDVLIVLEPIVFNRMLGISEHRRQFTGLFSTEFIDRFRARRPTTFPELRLLWGDPATTSTDGTTATTRPVTRGSTCTASSSTERSSSVTSTER